MRIRTTAAASILAILATVGGSTWADAAVSGLHATSRPTNARMVPVTISGRLTPVLGARGPVEGAQSVQIMARYRDGWVVLAEGQTARDRFAATVRVDSRLAGVPAGGTIPVWVVTDDDAQRVTVTIRRPGC